VITAAAGEGAQELLAFVLRPGRSSAGRGAVAVLRRTSRRLQQALPETELLLRGDSSFGLTEVYAWMRTRPAPGRLSARFGAKLVTAGVGQALHAASPRRVRGKWRAAAALLCLRVCHPDLAAPAG